MEANNKEVKLENSKKSKSKEGFFIAHKNEFKKITWPKKKVLVKQTIIVIIISIIVGAIIFGYDALINFSLEKLIQFIS